MPKFVVSANYLDRQSELRWLVRREGEPLASALAVKSLIARGVRFVVSSADEQGFGCRTVAMAESVEVDAENSGGERLTWEGFAFTDAAGKYVQTVGMLSLSASGEVRSIPLADDAPKAAEPVAPEPKVVKADVLNAIGQIRETAASTEGDGRVNVDVAMVVVRALENELGDSPIVHVESGGVDYARIAALMADDVADMVVKRWQAASSKRPQPPEMAPVPWSFSKGAIRDADGYLIWRDMDLEAVANRPVKCAAIVEAVNAYFAPQTQPPTPSEAAAANAETQIPDTAGYPLPDYDAVDIPSFENASQPTPSDSDPLRHALADALVSATSHKRRIAITSMCLRSAVAGMAPYRQMSFPEMDQVAFRMTQHLVSEIKAEVSKRTTTQRPAA